VIRLERRGGSPLRIGHRGAAALAPENTLRSFRAALEAGVDLVEFDVIRLRTGELAVGHSHDLFELSHGAARGRAEARGLAELRELCPELPSFDDALEFFAREAPETGVHVDLKSNRAADEVALAVRRHGLLGRTLVSSFHLAALRRMGRLEPGLRTGVSFPRDRASLAERDSLAPVARAALRTLRTLAPSLVGYLLARSRATALALHHDLVTPALVRRAHARGASVVAWTVDVPEDLARVDSAGVDAVVTNDPSIFVSTLLT
jgi:glycerophosphoryl diester phosphodiesterase